MPRTTAILVGCVAALMTMQVRHRPPVHSPRHTAVFRLYLQDCERACSLICPPGSHLPFSAASCPSLFLAFQPTPPCALIRCEDDGNRGLPCVPRNSKSGHQPIQRTQAGTLSLSPR